MLRGEPMEALTCDVIEVHPQMIMKLRDEMKDQEQYESLSEFFKLFGDPTRLKILSLLFHEELCVCDIAELLEMNPSAISHQLRILRQNRIIRSRRKGKNIYYALDDKHIEWIYNSGLEHILE